MTNDSRVGLWIGDRMIHDLLNPDPEEIDITAIERVLWSTTRFSGHPDALLIRQHTWLTEEIARIDGQPEEVLEWCRHHDDHEGIIGDIPGPLKEYLMRDYRASGRTSDPLTKIEAALDLAICLKRGIQFPSNSIRHTVHAYDKLAETIEWLWVLERPHQSWNRNLPRWMPAKMAMELAETAMNQVAAAEIWEAA